MPILQAPHCLVAPTASTSDSGGQLENPSTGRLRPELSVVRMPLVSVGDRCRPSHGPFGAGGLPRQLDPLR